MGDTFDREFVRSVPRNLPTDPQRTGRAGMRGDGALPAVLEGLPLDLEGGNESPLWEYWCVLFKYRYVLAACIVLGTVLALVYSFTVTPMYTTQSKIRISTYEPVLAATKIEDMLQQKSKEANYLETQVEELKSFSLGDKVLANKTIRDYFGPKGSESEAAAPEENKPGAVGVYRAPVGMIRAYLGSIAIKPVRRTSLVAIEATSPSPPIAAEMALEHARSYIDWVRSSRVEQQSRALQFLHQQADELRGKVADLEREMADYAEANSIVAVNKDENIVVQKMSQMSQALTDLTSKRMEAENLAHEAELSLSNDSAGFDDVSTQSMRTELARLQGEYQELSAKFMPGYPKMQQLRSQVEALKISIQTQRKQIALGLKAKAQALIEQEKAAKEDLEEQKSKAFELSKKQVQYNILNRDLTSSRELLENVMKQMKETSLSVESNSSNVSIVDYPVVPTSPSFPRKSLLVLIGLGLGTGLGVAIAFALNYVDNSIKTPEEVRGYLKLPNLGVVPSFEMEGLPNPTLDPNARAAQSPQGGAGDMGDDLSPRVLSGHAGPPVLFLMNPRSLAAEAYRTIRTGILLSQAGEPPRTILVSSAQSSEGKTTSSVNLAASLASSGARVVLIDADLRRPTMHKHFKIDGGLPGLVDIITGQRLFEEVAIRDLIKRITFIPAGRIPPNPAELLGSYEMLSLLERLAGEFDYVLVDSPPILPVTDSVVLSRFVDGVVLVVRAGNTPRKVVADAKNRLLAVGARLLGTVLNDVDITGGDYYYYNRYYHSYYQRDEDRRDNGRDERAVS